MNKKVLIIEDDYAIMRGLKDSFTLKNYEVYTAMDGEQALSQALNYPVDIIILDIMLPKINGYQVCFRLRELEIDTPIIMLTAKGEESEVVRGLNLGADDYIVKPFSVAQLHAKCSAFIRRYKKEEPEVYCFGDFEFNLKSGILSNFDNLAVPLTPKEYSLLHLFLRKDGCVLSRDSIINIVWGTRVLATLRSVDRCVNTLRKKIEGQESGINFIQSVRDVGYRFSSSGHF